MNHSLYSLASALPEGTDAAVIISNTNRRYFTGFTSSLGYLIVTASKKAFLLVDFRYGEAASQQAQGCEVIVFGDLKKSLGEVIRDNNIRTMLLEGSAFTINDSEQFDRLIAGTGAVTVKSSKLDELIGKMRIIKTAKEIENIIHAQRITERALEETLKLIKEGVCEKDIALELEYRMRRLGAEGISFDLIVIAGEKTSMPHGVPGENCIKPGDFITFDIGALLNGYHSDMTRTYAFGKVSEKQKKVYHTVYEAQKKGLETVRAGVRCCEVDAAARNLINQAGYEGYFGHSTGHGVGLDIHELPYVSSRSETILQSGMVITVEPGIYLPKEFGVRIEDMAAVTADGCINLATMPKELIVL